MTKRLRWPTYCVLAIILSTVVTLLLAMQVVAPDRERASIKDGRPDDPHIQYIGRWDIHNLTREAISNWGGAYLKTKFTGNRLQIRLGAMTNMYVQIDGGEDVYYPNVTGIVNLTPKTLAVGVHTLRVAARSEWDSIQFQGLILETDAITMQADISPTHIEFIGDSITAGLTASKATLSSYGWLIGEKLKVEHTHIAFSGICLVDYCKDNPRTGMQTQYFKEQTVQAFIASDWDFTRYQPQAVVINIGTNDSGHVPDIIFQNTYTVFLQMVRQKYPHAAIFVLSTFLNYMLEPTRQAALNIIARGDANVYYINTAGWLLPGGDYTDGVHPSDSGHIRIAQLLEPLIASHIARSY